jgi:small subunit ribosomal protein S6
MQKNYELMVLLHPDLEIDVETPISKVEKLVNAAGGRVTKRDNWGKKRLAYRIARQDFAIYVYFETQLPTGKVRELENSLLITDEVLRHLLVVHEENQKPDKAGGDKAKSTKRASSGGEAEPESDQDVEQEAVKTKEGEENG